MSLFASPKRSYKTYQTIACIHRQIEYRPEFSRLFYLPLQASLGSVIRCLSIYHLYPHTRYPSPSHLRSTGVRLTVILPPTTHKATLILTKLETRLKFSAQRRTFLPPKPMWQQSRSPATESSKKPTSSIDSLPSSHWHQLASPRTSTSTPWPPPLVAACIHTSR